MLARRARTQLLWRVRRKLIISYLFIGVVPAILIVTFFVLSGLLLFANLSSFLIRASLTDLAGEATSVARIAALEFESREGEAAIREALAAARGRDAAPGSPASRSRSCRCPRHGAAAARRGGGGAPAPTRVDRRRVAATGRRRRFLPGVGPLRRLRRRDRPGGAGAQRRRARRRHRRACGGRSAERHPGFAVVVDVPVAGAVKRAVENATGIAIGPASARGLDAGCRSQGRRRPGRGRRSRAAGGAAERAWRFQWVALLDHVDWTTGKTEPLTMNIGLSVPAIYQRLSASQASLGGTRSFGDLLLVGAAHHRGPVPDHRGRARSSWGSRWRGRSPGAVHELFAGTERVRQGDFGHRIPVLANDQLGELADSFNQMTGSIEDLLRQAAEKKRLEEEMRLAREIQMSLLPRGPLLMPGLTITALCVPAREVGGDYYDFLPLAGRALRRADRRRVGQGHVRRALHGRAEGADPVAQPDPPRRRASC